MSSRWLMWGVAVLLSACGSTEEPKSSMPPPVAVAAGTTTPCPDAGVVTVVLPPPDAGQAQDAAPQPTTGQLWAWDARVAWCLKVDECLGSDGYVSCAGTPLEQRECTPAEAVACSDALDAVVCEPLVTPPTECRTCL